MTPTYLYMMVLMSVGRRKVNGTQKSVGGYQGIRTVEELNPDGSLTRLRTRWGGRYSRLTRFALLFVVTEISWIRRQVVVSGRLV